MEIGEWFELLGAEWTVFAKRLSGNDTGLTGGHQVGFYLPKEVAFTVLWELEGPLGTNPDLLLETVIDSHGETRTVRAIWYNRGTRDEVRLTRWGGGSSPLQDPENTGGLLLVAFRLPGTVAEQPRCRIWICRSAEEEEVASVWLGERVEPGSWVVGGAQVMDPRVRASVVEIHQGDLPAEWETTFPRGDEIVHFIVGLLPSSVRLSPDQRLLKRRDLEFRVFRLLERLHLLPTIAEGFIDVDEFLTVAHSVTNRRKARAGRSLELHLREIFREEDVPFTHGASIEGGKRPDFLFPGVEAYDDPGFPAARLRVLGVKTTLRDRWRQVLNEADRVPSKHLFTLQEGVSLAQFGEIAAAGLTLVAPAQTHTKFPAEIRPGILSLGGLLEELRSL